MNGTNHFKNTIHSYLEQRASNDELFAESYAKENKNIDDCITFIINEVKRLGCCGLTDGEVYSLAVRYYENNIEVGEPIKCNIVSNHTYELTEEEKAQARHDAIQRYQNEMYQKQKQASKPTTKKAEQAQVKSLTLF